MRALLLEAKDNLQRMLAAIPLTDDERAAVDEGRAALDGLLHQRATPRQIGAPLSATLLPIISVKPARTGVPQRVSNWSAERMTWSTKPYSCASSAVK